MHRFAIISLSIMLGACGNPDGGQPTATNPPGPEEVAAMAKVVGTVSYRERMALTPDAVLHVVLNDVSRADAPAIRLGEQTIENPGQVPIDFAIEYDASVIDERLSYAVRAEIRDGGRLIFTTDQHYPVIARGAGKSVDLILVRLSGATEGAVTLIDTRWELVSLDGTSVSIKPDREPVHFVIDGETRHIAGFAGCNRFTGTFELKEGKPSVGAVAVTAMACIDGMEQEQVFLRALEVFNRYELEGDTLRLFVDRMLLASFKARLPD